MASVYNNFIWLPLVSYEENDIVYYDNKFYYCIEKTPPANLFISKYYGGYKTLKSIELPHFLWKPSYKSQIEFTPKVVKASFGDGYEQTYEGDINNNLLEFNLVFENRNDKESLAIIHFLNQRGNSDSFFWTPDEPFNVTKIFYCSSFNIIRNFKDNNTINAVFKEKQILSTVAPNKPPVETLEQSIYNNLLAHWRLYDGELLPASGGTIQDRVGNNDLTVAPALLGLPLSRITFSRRNDPQDLKSSLVTGSFFLNTNIYVNASSSVLRLGNQTKSFSGWFQNGIGTNGSAFFGADNSSDRGYWLYIDSLYQYTFKIYDTNNTLQTVTVTIPNEISSLEGSNPPPVFINCGYDASIQKSFIQVLVHSTLDGNLKNYYLIEESSNTFVPRQTLAEFKLYSVENTTDRLYAESALISNFSIFKIRLSKDQMYFLYNPEVNGHPRGKVLFP